MKEILHIENKIYYIRNQQVMLDFDLANMYQVETRTLKQSIRRNIHRFPDDFMFELTKEEWIEVITNCDNLSNTMKFSPSIPLAFTQEGVAMLSGILRSPIAIQVNIHIMRAFVGIRKYLYQHAENSKEIEKIWKHVKSLEYSSEENLKAINDLSEDTQNSFDDIYVALTELSDKKESKTNDRNPIGFVKPKKPKK